MSKSDRVGVVVMIVFFALLSGATLFDRAVSVWGAFAIFCLCMVFFLPISRPIWAGRDLSVEGDATVIRLLRKDELIWEMPWADLSHWISSYGSITLINQSGRRLYLPNMQNLMLSAALRMHRAEGSPIFKDQAYKVPRWGMRAMLPISLVGLVWSGTVVTQYMSLSSSDVPDKLERMNALPFLWAVLALFAGITGLLMWIAERLSTRTNPQIGLFKRSENPWTLTDHLAAREFSPFSDRVTDWLPDENFKDRMRKERQLVYFTLVFFGAIGLGCFALPAPVGPVLFGCYAGVVALLAALSTSVFREVDPTGTLIRTHGNDLTWVDGESVRTLTARRVGPAVSYLNIEATPKKQTLDPSRFHLMETENPS